MSDFSFPLFSLDDDTFRSFQGSYPLDVSRFSDDLRFFDVWHVSYLCYRQKNCKNKQITFVKLNTLYRIIAPDTDNCHLGQRIVKVCSTLVGYHLITLLWCMQIMITIQADKSNNLVWSQKQQKNHVKIPIDVILVLII